MFLVVVVTVALLAIVTFMPIAISKWNDNRLLNEFVVEKIESKESVAFMSKLSTNEKVALLNDYNERNQNYVVINQRRANINDDFEKAKEKVTIEIEKLQNLKIMPEFDFANTFQDYSLETETYAKATDPESSVVILRMYFQGEKDSLNIWMDGNDNKIYRYIYSRTTMADYTDSNVDIQYLYGVKYLGLSEEETYKYCMVVGTKKMFQVNCY